MPNDWDRRDRDIHDIIIRNVIAHSYLCYTVRLLPAMASIYNVVIDGVIDTRLNWDLDRGATLLLGDGGTYGENLPDSMRNVTVSNLICNSYRAVMVAGYLADSVISNVVNRNPACEAITVKRENGLRNVAICGAVTAK